MSKKKTLMEQAPWRQVVRKEIEPVLEDLARDFRLRGSEVSVVADEPDTGHLGWRLRIYPPRG